MRWRVQIYLAPFVQEWPEKFEIEGIETLISELEARAVPLNFVREIKVFPYEKKEQSGC